MDNVRVYIEDKKLREFAINKFKNINYVNRARDSDISFLNKYKEVWKIRRGTPILINLKKFKGIKKHLLEMILTIFTEPNLFCIDFTSIKNFFSAFNKGNYKFIRLKTLKAKSKNDSILDILKYPEFIEFSNKNKRKLSAIFAHANGNEEMYIGEIIKFSEPLSELVLKNGPEITMWSGRIFKKRSIPLLSIL